MSPTCESILLLHDCAMYNFELKLASKSPEKLLKSKFAIVIKNNYKIVYKITMISKLRKSCLVLRCALPNTTHAQFLNKLTSMCGLSTLPATEHRIE